MSDLFWLSDEQMARLKPFFPKSHGRPRVDDRRVLSGIIFINRNGLRWRGYRKNKRPFGRNRGVSHIPLSPDRAGPLPALYRDCSPLPPLRPQKRTSASPPCGPFRPIPALGPNAVLPVPCMDGIRLARPPVFSQPRRPVGPGSRGTIPWFRAPAPPGGRGSWRSPTALRCRRSA